MADKAITTPAPADASADRGRRKTRVGMVISDKMDKTIVVGVIRRVPHPKFHKIVKKTTKLYAADEKGETKPADASSPAGSPAPATPTAASPTAAPSQAADKARPPKPEAA